MTQGDHTFTVQPRVGPAMNRKRVIVWMTAGVFAMLAVITIGGYGSLPPWPVWLSFGVSHLFFCIVVAKVKPFRGPYTTPMLNRDSD
ncbi:MAG: hypothetical protein KDE14_00500 [Rhodobacteraceae bacterium]|nr:hypothetical protein [Paracoccaceae bacterium]